MIYNPIRTVREPEKHRPHLRKDRSPRDGKMMRVRSNENIPGELYDPEWKFPVSILKYHASESECNSSKRLHPSQKPVAMMEYLIKTYSNEFDIVLDSCVGSGTTLEACYRTNRHGIGMENDGEIFAVARKRLEALSPDIPLTVEA